jgi:hypothetical protein
MLALMTIRIPKSVITDAGISIADFPAQVEAFSKALRAWLDHMEIVVAETKHPPAEPNTADYPDAAKYRQALERHAHAMANRAKAYLPPNPPAVVIIALNKHRLPDFEIVEDAMKRLENK